MTMTQRKFKHKPTGIIFELGCKNCVVPKSLIEEQDYGTVPLWIVENSNEWEEVTRPELVEERWYLTDTNSIFRYSHTEEAEVYGDNFVGSDFEENIGGGLIDVTLDLICGLDEVKREATPKEIRKALDAIRVHKGLTEGATAKPIPGTSRTNFHVTGRVSYFGDYDGSDRLIDDNGILYDSGVWAQKVEEPILVTEDEHSLNYGDTYWVLRDDNWDLSKMEFSSNTIQSSKVMRFYYRENAEAYIERHKPRYSNEDLLNMVSALTSYEVNTDSNSLATLDYRQGVSDAVSHAISLLQNVRNQKS